MNPKPFPRYEGVDDSFTDELLVLSEQQDWELRYEKPGVYYFTEHSAVLVDDEDGDTLVVLLCQLESEQKATIGELCERLGGKKWAPPPLTPAQKRRVVVSRFVGLVSVIAIVGLGYFYGMWWVLPRMFAAFLLMGLASSLWDYLETK